MRIGYVVLPALAAAAMRGRQGGAGRDGCRLDAASSNRRTNLDDLRVVRANDSVPDGARYVTRTALSKHDRADHDGNGHAGGMAMRSAAGLKHGGKLVRRWSMG